MNITKNKDNNMNIWNLTIFFCLKGLVLGMALKGLRKLVIFSVDIWLWFSVAITYSFRADIFFIMLDFHGHDFTRTQ